MLKKDRDILWGIFSEGGLLFVVALIGWAAKTPLVFASLGPTVYEMIEQPRMPSARVYNVIVGHFIGLASGFFSLYVLKAWTAPSVTAAGLITPERVWAIVLSALLTTLITLLADARQPAALATTLLISLGAMQTARDAAAIVTGVLIVTALGEPLRRLRLRRMLARNGGEPN